MFCHSSVADRMHSHLLSFFTKTVGQQFSATQTVRENGDETLAEKNKRKTITFETIKSTINSDSGQLVVWIMKGIGFVGVPLRIPAQSINQSINQLVSQLVN